MHSTHPYVVPNPTLRQRVSEFARRLLKPMRRSQRLVRVWDNRLASFRDVDLNDPNDPLWMMAYHVHAVGKGVATGPAL